MLSIYVIITAIYLILAVCDAIIGIGFAKHSGQLKLGILTTLIDLFFTLTLLTYASNRYEEPSYGLSALFFILSYLIEIINLFVNKNPLLSDETTLAEVCSGGATLIGCICSISNLKDRFRGAWFLFIAMVLMAMFGGIGKTEQTIDFFSILSAILGLIFIISIYIVGDRKRFLQEFEREYDDFYDYTYESTPLSSTTDASIQAASGQREDLDENLDELGQKSHKNIWWLVAVGVAVVGIIVFHIVWNTAKPADDSNFTFFKSSEVADEVGDSFEADYGSISFMEPFYPPVYDGDFKSFVFTILNRLSASGMTASQFGGEIAKSKVTGKQAKYDTPDGVRLQYFFDSSPRNNDARITGIALSRTDCDSEYECGRLDKAVEAQGYVWVKSGMWRTPGGLYISPGFTTERVYAYIYFPNAPDKSSAPRQSRIMRDIAEANWISTGRGFSVPSFMKKTKGDDYEWGDLVYSFGPVDICYSANTYRGAYGSFPEEGEYLANGTQIKNITYSAPKHSIYSGYLSDGRVYYMKVGVEDMLEESHEIGDDICIGGLYAMPYLTAVYPKSYEKACEKIIKMVMKWNG